MDELIGHAIELLSEDGENPEYDRAIAEVVTSMLGLPLDAKEHIWEALRVGVGWRSRAIHTRAAAPVAEAARSEFTDAVRRAAAAEDNDPEIEALWEAVSVAGGVLGVDVEAIRQRAELDYLTSEEKRD